MTLYEYLVVIKKNWLLVLGLLLAFVTLSIIATFVIPPVYQAKTQLFVATRADANNPLQVQQAGAFSAARVKSLSLIHI